MVVPDYVANGLQGIQEPHERGIWTTKGGRAFEVFWTTVDITKEPEVQMAKFCMTSAFFVKEAESTKV